MLQLFSALFIGIDCMAVGLLVKLGYKRQDGGEGKRDRERTLSNGKPGQRIKEISDSYILSIRALQ